MTIEEFTINPTNNKDYFVYFDREKRIFMKCYDFSREKELTSYYKQDTTTTEQAPTTSNGLRRICSDHTIKSVRTESVVEIFKYESGLFPKISPSSTMNLGAKSTSNANVTNQQNSAVQVTRLDVRATLTNIMLGEYAQESTVVESNEASSSDESYAETFRSDKDQTKQLTSNSNTYTLLHQAEINAQQILMQAKTSFESYSFKEATPRTKQNQAKPCDTSTKSHSITLICNVKAASSQPKELKDTAAYKEDLTVRERRSSFYYLPVGKTHAKSSIYEAATSKANPSSKHSQACARFTTCKSNANEKGKKIAVNSLNEKATTPKAKRNISQTSMATQSQKSMQVSTASKKCNFSESSKKAAAKIMPNEKHSKIPVPTREFHQTRSTAKAKESSSTCNITAKACQAGAHKTTFEDSKTKTTIKQKVSNKAILNEKKSSNMPIASKELTRTAGPTSSYNFPARTNNKLTTKTKSSSSLLKLASTGNLTAGGRQIRCDTTAIAKSAAKASSIIFTSKSQQFINCKTNPESKIAVKKIPTAIKRLAPTEQKNCLTTRHVKPSAAISSKPDKITTVELTISEISLKSSPTYTIIRAKNIPHSYTEWKNSTSFKDCTVVPKVATISKSSNSNIPNYESLLSDQASSSRETIKNQSRTSFIHKAPSKVCIIRTEASILKQLSTVFLSDKAFVATQSNIVICDKLTNAALFNIDTKIEQQQQEEEKEKSVQEQQQKHDTTQLNAKTTQLNAKITQVHAETQMNAKTTQKNAETIQVHYETQVNAKKTQVDAETQMNAKTSQKNAETTQVHDETQVNTKKTQVDAETQVDDSQIRQELITTSQAQCHKIEFLKSITNIMLSKSDIHIDADKTDAAKSKTDVTKPKTIATKPKSADDSLDANTADLTSTETSATELIDTAPIELRYLYYHYIMLFFDFVVNCFTTFID